MVGETHPIADNNDCILQIPMNTVIFDSVIFDRKNDQCKREFETKVNNRCIDINMRVAR